MGNILQDMMGLLSRKKVVKEVEATDFILLGRTPNPEDSMFVTPKMTNELITIKDLKLHFEQGEVSGSGTLNTIPLWTPDGNTLGDSIIHQGALGTRIGIGTTDPQRELDVFGGIRVRGPLDLFQQNNNSFAGQDAGNWYNIVGNSNSAFGKDSQKNQLNGSNNTSVGYQSMNEATSGNFNTAVGNDAMQFNDGGSFNTAVGALALQDQEAGQGNTAIGYNSLNNKDESNFNTAVGHISLFNISTGFKNIGIGDNVGTLLSTGSRNVLIGSGANVLANNNTNSIVIGEGAVGAGSNTVTLGNNNITDTHLKGNVIFSSTITADGATGTAGQVLSSTGNNVQWIDNTSSVQSVTAVSPLTGGTITETGSIGINQASTSADGYLSSTDWNTFNLKQSTSEKGLANGYAPLDSNNKVPTVHLPDSLVGAVVYQGTWNASTNIPTLPAPDLSNKGHYYIVSDPGTYSGITYAIGDWAISNGSAWQKVDNTQDVNSVFGRQGNVVANQSDYATFYADINDAYSDAKVDLNLNVSSATSAQVLSWSGTDYVWVDQQSGNPGTVTTVSALTAGNALDVLVTNSSSTPEISLTWAGAGTQYIDGTGNLQPFPSIPTLPANIVNTVTGGTNITTTNDNTTGDVIVNAPDAVVNTPDTFGSPKVTYIVSLTQTEYDGLVTAGTINANTLYIIL